MTGLQAGHPRNCGTVPAGTQKLREVSPIKSLYKQMNFVSCFFHRIVLDN